MPCVSENRLASGKEAMTLEMSEIRQLALLMREAGLKRLEYTSGAERLLLEREGGVKTAAEEAALSSAPAETERADEKLYTVTSPMVGVFYAAPGPNEPPFVTIGDKVAPGDTLCIIEAMKMMNEIVSEKSGTVVEICVGNGQIVEYGHPLFRLRLEQTGG